jgi:hypothetical protein
VGNQFRKSAEVWCDLANAVLPDSVPLLKETRDLKSKKRQLFIERGGDALDEIAAINTRLNGIKAAVADSYPMSQNEVVALRQDMRERVLKIRDMEREAVEAMQSAIL